MFKRVAEKAVEVARSKTEFIEENKNAWQVKHNLNFIGTKTMEG